MFRRAIACSLLLAAPALLPAADAPKKVEDNAREIAGTAEFLRSVPKHFAVLEACDPTHGRVSLRRVTGRAINARHAYSRSSR